MSTPIAVSPLFDAISRLHPAWALSSPVVVPKRFGANDDHYAARLGIADVSHRPRFGAKGPGTAAWLRAFGLPVPHVHNTWEALPSGGHVLRLGFTEFLIEGDGEVIAALERTDCPPQVYRVLREDAALVLTGAHVNDLLLQTCNVNFRALDLTTRPVVMTSMAGVSVTVMPGERNGQPYYRLWCDGTFGPYLWHTLVEIAAELGGGPVGLECIE